MELEVVDIKAILKFLGEHDEKGFWLFVLLTFIFVGGKHVAPIITAIGNARNERRKADQAHERAMLKLKNKQNDRTQRKK